MHSVLPGPCRDHRRRHIAPRAAVPRSVQPSAPNCTAPEPPRPPPCCSCCPPPACCAPAGHRSPACTAGSTARCAAVPLCCSSAVQGEEAEERQEEELCSALSCALCHSIPPRREQWLQHSGVPGAAAHGCSDAGRGCTPKAAAVCSQQAASVHGAARGRCCRALLVRVPLSPGGPEGPGGTAGPTAVLQGPPITGSSQLRPRTALQTALLGMPARLRAALLELHLRPHEGHRGANAPGALTTPMQSCRPPHPPPLLSSTSRPPPPAPTAHPGLHLPQGSRAPRAAPAPRCCVPLPPASAPTPPAMPDTMEATPEAGAPRSPSMVRLDWLFRRCFSSTFSDSSWSMSACRASMVSSNSLQEHTQSQLWPEPTPCRPTDAPRHHRWF